MKRIDAQKYINEIIAFASGKIIEHKSVGSGVWYKDENPSFACHLEYRIKPQPKLIPFTFEDNLLFRDKWIIQKEEYGGCGFLNSIVGVNTKNITIINSTGSITSKSYEDLLRIYIFEDGSPCGKYINE